MNMIEKVKGHENLLKFVGSFWKMLKILVSPSVVAQTFRFTLRLKVMIRILSTTAINLKIWP